MGSVFLLLPTDVASAQEQGARFPLDQSCDWHHAAGSSEHKGAQAYALDLNCEGDAGMNVYAPLSGTIVRIDRTNTTGCGLYVDIYTPSSVGDGVVTHTCHFAMGSIPNSLSVGQSITAGTVIGRVGGTAGPRPVPPHLHIAFIRSTAEEAQTQGWRAPGSVRAIQMLNLPAFTGIETRGSAGGLAGGAIIEGGVFDIPGIGALKLEVKWPLIPGTNRTLNELIEGEDRVISLPALIQILFSFGTWITGIIAFFSIVYVGFAYIISGSNPGERAKAIERIRSIGVGGLILLLSVTLLNVLNPDLAELQDLGLSKQRNSIEIPGLNSAPTEENEYAPIPVTNRGDAKNLYQNILDSAGEDLEECLKQNRYDPGGVCKDQFEKTVIQSFKELGALIAHDDDAPAVTCAALCLQEAGAPTTCNQFGTGIVGGDEKGSDNGGAKAIWEKLQNNDWVYSTEKPYYAGLDVYGKEGSPFNAWLEGKENQDSRTCLAQFVVRAIDAPTGGDWDACLCKSP